MADPSSVKRSERSRLGSHSNTAKTAHLIRCVLGNHHRIVYSIERKQRPPGTVPEVLARPTDFILKSCEGQSLFDRFH